jgi:hypothetical protein
MSLMGISSAPNAEVALMTPHEYMRRWQIALIEHRDVLLIFGLGAGIFLLLTPLIWTAPRTPLALVSDLINFMLYTVGVGGCWVALRAIAQTQIERALAAEIIRNVGRPQSKSIELSKLPEYILPQNRTSPPLAMPRIVRFIQQEAQNLRFGSNSEIIQPFMDEALENVFEIVNLQKLALRGGIFATFFGLLLAMKQMAYDNSTLLSGQGDVLGTLMQQFSTSLFIAFSGSAVGLHVALVLGALLLSLRARQAALFREMTNATAATLEIARQVRNDGQEDVITELGVVHQMIRQLSEQLHDHGLRIATGLEATQSRINLQTDTIAMGLKELEQTKHSYDHLVNDVTIHLNNFTAEIRDIYRNLSLDRFREDLRNGIVAAGEVIAGTLTDTKDAINNQTNEMGAGVKMLAQTSENLAGFLQKLDEFQREFLIKARKAQNADPITASNNELQSSLQQLRESVDNLTRMTYRLNTSVNTSFWTRTFGRR